LREDRLLASGIVSTLTLLVAAAHSVLRRAVDADDQINSLKQENNTMFIAMNRFKVIKGSEAAFESVWLSRDSHLEKVPGFVEFHLLKGPEAVDHTLYQGRSWSR
jgi:Antibiotic biosynthesis monooxygenase